MEHGSLIQELFRVEAVKFGDFTLKSGQKSSVYADLRTAITFPDILQAMGSALAERIAGIEHDFVCGVPYTAWPLATCVALLTRKAMLLRRKEAKTYGTRTSIHGVFKQGQTCVLIEDVVTTGSSILETFTDLQDSGLVVSDVVAFLDREQGARETLARYGLKLHSVLTMQEVLNAQ